MRTCQSHTSNTCDSFVRYQSTSAVSTAASSQSHSESVLADFFPADEYVDVWAPAPASSPSSSPSTFRRTIEPLNCPELDRPTRFLLSLLDDSIHGIRRGKDKATTARCHTQLERLADLSIGGKRLRGRAQRADEILKRMEKILLLNGGTGSGNMNVATDGSNRESSKSLYAAQHKYELPLPNRKTYLMVLRLYAQTSGPAALAERAEAIVANMEAASAKLGDLSLRPQTVAYNQVISAWASSTDPNKAYRAARVLAKLKEMGMADASSYGHVLRACATTTASLVDDTGTGGSDDGTSNELHRSQQAALKIAMGLWRDFDGKMKRRNGQEDARGTSIGNDDDGNDNADVDVDFDTTTQGAVEVKDNDADLVSSHFYTFLIRTLQFMPKPAERDAAVSKAFKDCCQYGMVNAHVLQVMYSVASEATCQDLLGDRLASQAVTAMKTVSGAAILAQKVPDAWTRKAVVVNSWGW